MRFKIWGSYQQHNVHWLNIFRSSHLSFCMYTRNSTLTPTTHPLDDDNYGVGLCKDLEACDWMALARGRVPWRHCPRTRERRHFVFSGEEENRKIVAKTAPKGKCCQNDTFCVVILIYVTHRHFYFHFVHTWLKESEASVMNYHFNQGG